MRTRTIWTAVGAAILPFFVLGVLSGTLFPLGNGTSIAEANAPDTCNYFDSPVLRRMYKCDAGNLNDNPQLVTPLHETPEVRLLPVICEYAARPTLRWMYGCDQYESLPPDGSIVILQSVWEYTALDGSTVPDTDRLAANLMRKFENMGIQ